MPFVITGIREKGFIVKVAGLFGFVHFGRMPWHYSTHEQWEIAYPFISDRRFFCKIHKILRDPLRVYIDGNVHEFKKFELTPGESYVGLILSKVKYGVFIDLGYDFNWEYGAMIGLMHKSQFNCAEEMEDCSPGTLMQVRLEGICQSGKLAIGRRSEFTDWETGKPQALIGKQTWALVKKNKPGSKAFFSIKGIYTGEPIIDSEHYHPLMVDRVKEMMKQLKDNETIDCHIVAVDEKKKTLLFKWNVEHLLEIVPGTTINNLLKPSSMKKLEDIKKHMEF